MILILLSGVLWLNDNKWRTGLHDLSAKIADGDSFMPLPITNTPLAGTAISETTGNYYPDSLQY